MESQSKSLKDMIHLLDQLQRGEIPKEEFLKNLKNIEDEYDLVNDVTYLSKGAQGEVMKVKRKGPNGKFYAIKKSLYSIESMNNHELEQVYREINNLRRLNHPNVANLIDVAKFNNVYPCIVLDLCDGSLYDYIVDFTNKKEVIPEDSIREIILSIAQSLQYIHEQNIVHRDLKPQNILHKSQNDKRIWKITDFGSSYQENRLNTTVNSAMTHVYASVEQLQQGAAVPAFDVWALGIILYQLMTGKLPYEAPNYKMIDLIKNSVRQPLPTTYSQDLRELADRMLTVQSTQRIKLVEVIYFLTMLIQNKGPVNLRLQFVERELYQFDNYFTGYLMQGQRFGYGSIEFGKGLKYEGEWRDDHINGKGKYTWPDGSTYEGEFKDDMRHGKGFSIAKNKETHEGQWVKGQKDGHGVHTWPDQSHYTGEFKEDKVHGRGTMVYANGDKFFGDWYHGKKAGKGIYTWTDGLIYEGEYKDDKKHGKGKMTYPDKSYYDGQWENDARHGEGVEKEDGEVRKGIWNEGEFKRLLE